MISSCVTPGYLCFQVVLHMVICDFKLCYTGFMISSCVTSGYLCFQVVLHRVICTVGLHL